MGHFIPDSVKRVIKDSGKNLLSSVIQQTGNRKQQLASGGSRFRNMLMANVYPSFAPDVVTGHLVAQWVNTIAVSFIWIFLGSMYANTVVTTTGRSGDGVLAEEEEGEFGYEADEEELEEDEELGPGLQPWEMLIPSKEKVAFVLRELATAAENWHDEL